MLPPTGDVILHHSIFSESGYGKRHDRCIPCMDVADLSKRVGESGNDYEVGSEVVRSLPAVSEMSDPH